MNNKLNKRSKMEETKMQERQTIITIAIPPSSVAKLEEMAGNRGRSAFVRNLIEQAWVEYQKMVLS
jgi:hypothetical protein